MELKSDIVLKGATWNRVDAGYLKKIFRTQWDIFKICLSIGILYDRQIDDVKEDMEQDGLNIPRSMFNRYSSEMIFFFQTAILTSKTIKLEEADRLYLAFSEEISEDEMEGEDEELLKKGVSDEAISFNKIEFLKKFANYGATKLEKCLSENDNETMENLMNFLNKSYKKETEELQVMQEVEDLIDEDGVDF